MVDNDPQTGDVDVSEQAWGSDFVADMLKAYDFEYVVFNPGASFRGIEESIVNYNDNDPKVIESPNEGLSVAISHGYAKATGDPALCVLHNVVGTLNGAMGIYNAFIDQVPIVILSGTGPMRKTQRRPWIDWIHTANVQGNLVRDFVKWDAQPTNVDGVAESFLRAYRIANTKPKGPTYVTLDHDIQEGELDEPMEIPSLEGFAATSDMGPEPAEIERAADLLVDADLPVVITDTVGDSRAAVDHLVDLAESLAAPVLDPKWRRFNFPTTHDLYLPESDVYREADVVLAVDPWDIDRVVEDVSNRIGDEIEGEFDLIEIGTGELGASGLFPNTYSLTESAVSILSDSELALASLTEAVESRLDGTDESRIDDRYRRMSERGEQLRQSWAEEAEASWDETPVSTARLAGEVWEVIEDEQWALVNNMYPPWVRRLWDVESYDQYIGGGSGGAGVGYGIGASIGAALAYEGTDRVPVNIQTDGDLMQYLAGLWVLGRYDLQLFSVMHNNRSLYNSTEHRMELAEYRGRDSSFDRALTGTGFVDPTPDFASVAEALGVSGYGPVEDPDELGPTLADAWEDVQDGNPVLVDVVCQPQ